MDIEALKSELSSHSSDAALDFISQELLPLAIVDDNEKKLFDFTLKTIYMFRLCKTIFTDPRYTLDIVEKNWIWIRISIRKWVIVVLIDVREDNIKVRCGDTLKLSKHSFSPEKLRDIRTQIEYHVDITEAGGMKCQHCGQMFDDLKRLFQHRADNWINEGPTTRDCHYGKTCNKCGEIIRGSGLGGWHGHRDDMFRHQAKCYGLDLLYKF